jgi:hypothetical protein
LNSNWQMTNTLQTRVYSLDFTPREVRATEEILNKLYEGAALGLTGSSLAYVAGLTLAEYRQLEQLDFRVEQAVVAGKADAERELSGILFEAARGGDAKTALELLKHKHNWAATQVVKQEISGTNGGPITLAAVDFRGLSTEELQTMKKMLEKTAGGGNG